MTTTEIKQAAHSKTEALLSVEINASLSPIERQTARDARMTIHVRREALASAERYLANREALAERWSRNVDYAAQVREAQKAVDTAAERLLAGVNAYPTEVAS